MVAATARLIPPSLHVDALLVGDDGLTIRVFAETPEVRCLLCGEPAERVHSRATRTLADLPGALVTSRAARADCTHVSRMSALPHFW